MSNNPEETERIKNASSDAEAPKIDRRTFLRNATVGGAALLSTPLLMPNIARAATSSGGSGQKPNILFMMVDEMRASAWFPQGPALDAFLPNLARLRSRSTSFTHHYTAASSCIPARGTLLTGLYSHQLGWLDTEISLKNAELNTAFPTFGTAVRDHGYASSWFGKWHLSKGNTLEPYGFDYGTFPSPNGGAQVGTMKDPHTTDQFLEWFDQKGDQGPWLTAVSWLNPHDILSYPQDKECTDYFKEHPAPSLITQLPGNFESEEDLIHHKKPNLHRIKQTDPGKIPLTGPDHTAGWLAEMNAYLTYQHLVDREIGRVLDALEARKGIAENTIIVFTSDHGEYAASHGMSGKSWTAYEESCNVPFYISDPTGRLVQSPTVNRTQLTSSVDLFPLFLTIASGSNTWRSDPRYSHLSQRADIAAIAGNPHAKGRPYVVHTSDELRTSEQMLPDVPHKIAHHVLAYRTASAKIATYHHWKEKSNVFEPTDHESEMYDYSTPDGRIELVNQAEDKPQLYAKLSEALTQDAIPNELRQPLPAHLQPAQDEAYSKYYEARIKVAGHTG